MAGLLFAAALYYKDKLYRQQSKQVRLGLAALRFLSVFIISALLLSPLLRRTRNEIQKPVLVLALDNSMSAGLGMGKSDQVEFNKAWNQLIDRFKDKYQVVPVSFGQSVRDSVLFDHLDKSSNISAPLEWAIDQYGDQNLGAVVLATDGIFNEGISPLYASESQKIPIFSVGLGDTIQKKDLTIKRALANQIVYLNDLFTVQADIGAFQFEGSNATVSIAHLEGEKVQTLKSENISINQNQFFKTLTFQIPATSPGIQHYRISVSRLSGENTYSNNQFDLFTQVLDSRIKVLMLAKSPHPDIAAIKYALESNKNYEVTVSMADEFKGNIKDYGFLVLHQIPDKNTSANTTKLLNDITTSKLPRLIVIGGQTDLNRLNQFQDILRIDNSGQSANDVQAIYNQAFLQFTTSDLLKISIGQFVPLQAPFGNYKKGPNAQVLLQQKIGQVQTDYPLLVFGESNGARSAILCAEGIWQWKLFDFLQHQNFDISNEIVTKSVQYTSTKSDQRKFRVKSARSIFPENEAIIFDAELYNDNFELINEPEVALSIRNSKNQEFTFQFNRQDRAYHLDAGVLAPGKYNFTGTTKFNDKTLTAKGDFTVKALQLELSETTADHNLLRSLSQQSGGQFFKSNQLLALGDSLEKLPTLKPILFEQTLTDPLLNLKWIFALLFMLLATEWFLRRYLGGY